MKKFVFRSYDNDTSKLADICKKVNYWHFKCYFENVEFKNCFKVKVKSDEILKSKFDHIFKFCDEYLIFLFVLLLCKGAYSYK